MNVKPAAALLLLLASLPAASHAAASCLAGNCHKPLTETKYLHGPVAAELAGARGCETCHIPAGQPCAADAKGTFKSLPEAAQMCSLCHDRGTGTQHSTESINCLQCHNPHGSDKTPTLQR